MSALVTELRKTQLAVLSVLRSRPTRGFSDEELVEHYKGRVRAGRAPMQTESGIRSRRAELVRVGLVMATGDKRLMSTGGLGQIWIPKN